MISEAVAALEAVAGAISQIENPMTLDSSITTMERETAKFREMANRIDRATNRPYCRAARIEAWKPDASARETIVASKRASLANASGFLNLGRETYKNDIQARQFEARSKQLANEVQNFVQRAPNLGIDQPALIRWQDSFEQLRRAMFEFARAWDAKNR